jgi:hypothetical protein
MERIPVSSADVTNTGTPLQKRGSTYEAGPRHVFQHSNGASSRPRRASIVATAHDLLGRLSRGQLSSASASSPAAEGDQS